jgi:hypothetical protein
MQSMSPVDEVRDFVAKNYLAPARERGAAFVTIRVRDVESALWLRNRWPLVHAALTTRRFLEAHGVELAYVDGSAQRATYTFKLF